MSWFEKAKTVLIEALDIQDDDGKNVSSAAATTATTTTSNANLATATTANAKLVAPNEAIEAKGLVTNVGAATSPLATISSSSSFMGTFFDNPNANEMVTTPPRTTSGILSAKRQSATSDSVDILSTPTSPSEVGVPPINNSDSSLELITATTASEIETLPDEEPSLPNSIVIITSSDTSQIADGEGDESEANVLLTMSGNILEQTQPLNDSTKTIKALPLNESNIADSDSTQSFEDIQMQISQKTKTPVAGTETKGDHSYSSTSSDIEIISNPNGDSNGATNCATTRVSPQKLKELSAKHKEATATHNTNINTMPLKIKGHQREPSEVSLLSEDSQTELDKLVNRISELNQVIEAREQRLLQSERQNAELLERNQELQAAVEAARKNAGSVDSNEAVQRLSSLEKKFQASIRERDALHIQIKALKEELQNKIPKEELIECNEMIAALQCEGEKLSKEILQQSNIIKKLRAKEKTSDILLKKNAEQISQLSSETERLKKSLAAKDEVERTQIEAVYKMTSEKRKVDEENAEYRNRNEDLQSKLEALQSSFDGVKQDLQQRSRHEEDKLKTENQEYLQTLNDMREKLRITEQAMVEREQKLHIKNQDLLRRLEEAELRAELCALEMSQTTTPLIRQIESLEKTLNQHTSNWNKQEKDLLQKLEESQTQLKSLQHIETVYKEKQELLRTRCNQLEEQLSNAHMEVDHLKIAIHQKDLAEQLQSDEYKKQIADLQAEQQRQHDKIAELNAQLTQLQLKYDVLEQQQHHHQQHSALTVAAVRAANLQNEYNVELQQQQREDNLHTQQQHSSPVLSIADSTANQETLGGIVDWQADDLECASNSGRQPSGIIQGVHLNFMPHNTTTLEHLQALLKQREGELTHLQWELSRLQAERGVLSEEIANLTIELENAREQQHAYETMEASYVELQRSYDALMQMYGEKAERTEELELDLVEIRQAYKLQIDELLAQPPAQQQQQQQNQEKRQT